MHTGITVSVCGFYTADRTVLDPRHDFGVRCPSPFTIVAAVQGLSGCVAVSEQTWSLDFTSDNPRGQAAVGS